MRSLLAALLLALPAAAQPETVVRVEFGDILVRDAGAVQACRRTGFARQLNCTPINLACHLPEVTVGERPSEEWVQSYLAAWECRYGAPHSAGVSRGDHSPLQTPTRLLLESSAPLGITHRHVGSPEEAVDGNLFSTRTQEVAVKTLLDRYADLIDGWPFGECIGEGCGGDTTEPPPPACTPAGWTCTSMSALQAAACRDKTAHCTDGRLGATSPACWRNAGTALGKPWLLYHRGVAGCDPWAVVKPPPPPPPPPEPRCGDGNFDAGETCETCPVDQPAGACEVEPPPPPPPPAKCAPPPAVAGAFAELQRVLGAIPEQRLGSRLASAWRAFRDAYVAWATTPGPPSTGVNETVVRP